MAAFDFQEISPIDALDRPYTTGDYSHLAHNYPDCPTSFVDFLTGYAGVTTGNFYTVPPGTRTGPVTLNINGPQDPIFVPQNAQLQARETRYGGLVKINWSPTDWLKFFDTFIITDNREQAQTLNQGFDFGGADKIFGANIVIPTTILSILPVNRSSRRVVGEENSGPGFKTLGYAPCAIQWELLPSYLVIGY